MAEIKGFFLSYFPEERKITYAKGGKVGYLRLHVGQRIRIEFYGEKRCIGYFTGEEWVPCPYNETKVSQCSNCRKRDVKVVFFEPTMAEEEYHKTLLDRLRKKKYTVYLAQVGDRVKVGMTPSSRFYERMIEQGARYFAKVMEVEGVEEARAFEKYIAELLSLPEFMTHSYKLNHYHETDGKLIKEVIERLHNYVDDIEAFGGSLLTMRVESITHNIPKKFELEKNGVFGRITGFYSAYVFWEREGSAYATPLHENIGRLIKIIL